MGFLWKGIIETGSITCQTLGNLTYPLVILDTKLACTYASLCLLATTNQRNGLFFWIGVAGITFYRGGKLVYDDIINYS